MQMNKTGWGPGVSLAAAVGLFVLAANTAWAADADKGKKTFEVCTGCHSDQPNAIGPTLKGVYGRKAGSLDSFRYSNAMLRSGLVWDETSLRDYIKDPQAKVKGNRMPFGGLAKPQDIDDVVAFLKDYK